MTERMQSQALLGLLLCMLWALGACGSESPVETGTAQGTGNDPSPATVETPESGPLQAILEQVNTNPTELGEGWENTDQWYTEGEHTEWTSGCDAFDRLGDMFNNGAPLTRVWERDGERAVTRSADFNWDAYEFAYDVERIPDTCPEFSVRSDGVRVTAVDESTFATANDRITDGDPNGVIVAIKLDAYPLPSPETDISLPEFDFGTETWIMLATRHNVVSQLIYTPGEAATSDIVALVDAQVAALVDAEVEGNGSFDPPEPIEERAAEGTVTDVVLTLDQLCRDGGSVEAGGFGWQLIEPIPQEWQGWGSIRGDLVMDGTVATFTSHDGDDRPNQFSVELTTGFTDLGCLLWD